MDECSYTEFNGGKKKVHKFAYRGGAKKIQRAQADGTKTLQESEG